MRPGQLEPNELEMAVLRAFAQREPRIAAHIQNLHVLSREFTGVGSFTRFQYEGSDPEHTLDLAVQIQMPGGAERTRRASILQRRSSHLPRALHVWR